MVHSTSKKSKQKRIVLIVVFLFCFFFQILPVIRSGLLYNYGMGFWGSNGHDAVWHLSLINHIKNPFKINLAIFSGQTLQNYHPFFDVLITYLSKLTRISTTYWYFQIFPIISTFLLLLTSFKIGKKLTKKFYGGILLLFLNSFANSFGFLISLIKSGQIGGESLFWSMQSPSNQLNPPFTLSLLFINFLLLLILDKENKIKFENIWILLILIITPITKAYGGVVVYSIFALYSLFSLIKKNKKPFILFLLSLPLSYLVFSIYNSSSASLFIFKPFWFVNSLIESPDRLFIPYLANMRYALEASGQIGPRLIVLYLFLIGTFYLGNFSWRMLGLLSLKKFKNNLKYPLFLTILITALIPLFFIQKGTRWNTIQFLYYSLFLSNIFLTFFLINLRKKKLKKILLILIISTTLLASYESLQRYLSNPAPTTISHQELEAITFLKEQPKSLVLTYPYDPYKKKTIKKSPLPIAYYETTAYISAFSHQNVFLEDQMNLDIIGLDWKSRRKQVHEFFDSQDKHFARGFLVNNQIDYIYLFQDQSFQLDPEDLQIDLIFKNDQVSLYQVRK